MPEENFGEKLERRALGAILSYAFFRAESAITIALTILLFFLFPHPFPWWPSWLWLVMGLVAEAALLYATVSDKAAAHRAVAEMLREKFNPREIHSKKLREQVEKALDYQARIEQLISKQRAGVLREHLTETSLGIHNWIANIYRLAQRLDAYEQDEVIQRDRRTVPQTIQDFRSRLKLEDDPVVRQQMEKAIAQKQAQLAYLERLHNTMEKAEFQLENTLAALGTVYTQIQLIGAQDIESGRAKRLRQDVDEQIAALGDIVNTMDEMYQEKEISGGGAL